MAHSGCCHSRPQQVNGSLPQGNPWSPVTMCCVLMGPFQQVAAEANGVKCKLFIDDQARTSSSLAAIRRAAVISRRWNAVVGPREDATKQQWMARRWGGQRRSFETSRLPEAQRPAQPLPPSWPPGRHGGVQGAHAARAHVARGAVRHSAARRCCIAVRGALERRVAHGVVLSGPFLPARRAWPFGVLHITQRGMVYGACLYIDA
ncbi:unnamed protein product, partial [Prorocentrum cordatum]